MRTRGYEEGIGGVEFIDIGSLCGEDLRVGGNTLQDSLYGVRSRG